MKKGGSILLLLCVIFLCLVVGIFIGRNLRGDYAQLPTGTNTVDTPTNESNDFRLDINEATKLQLMELPGIGQMLAERIIDYRTKNGPFQSVDDLINVEGIGQKKLQAIIELIKVGG